METLTETQRTYTNVETGAKCKMYTSHDASKHHLIYEDGTRVKKFYTCAFSGVSIKINNTKIVQLNSGEFYDLKEAESVTHKKYIGFKKFTKIN